MAISVEACLFDLYDTLVHFDPERYRKNAAEAARMCGVSAADYAGAWKSLTVESNLGRVGGTDGRVLRLLEALGASASEDLAQSVALAEHRFLRTHCHLYPDAADVLMRLRRAGIRTGLVTNASPSVLEVIESRGLERLMDCMVISYQLGIRKPDPGIYGEALRRLSVAPEATVFVGDGNDRELDGAKAVGLTTIWVRRQGFRAVETQQSADENADFVVGSLSEIPPLLGVAL